MFGSGGAASAAAETASTPATTSSPRRLTLQMLRDPRAVDRVEEMRVVRGGAQRNARALGGHVLRVYTGDEPRPLAGDLRRTEDEGVRPDLLRHLDLRGDALSGEFERLGPQADGHVVPAPG